ncbi:MAG: LPP20 family lipoprotein [Sphaerochaetaceae bacterium]
MKKRIYPIVVILFALFAVGCLSSNTSGKRPVWIELLYDRSYPQSKYLCAIGSGSNYENAVGSAYSSLSQSFSVRVESTLQTFSESYYSETSSYFGDSMIDSGILSTQSETILGAKVVNVWVDKQNMVWVRVALERAKGAKLYEKEIKQLAQQIEKIQLSAMKESSSLSRYFRLQKALPLAEKHQQLIQQLSVLKGSTVNPLLRNLESQLDSIASAVTVTVTVTKAPNQETKKRIENGFIALLNDYGFSVGQGEAVVEIDYESTIISSANSPYTHSSWSVEASITEKGKTIGSFNKSGRATALNEKEANDKALKEALAVVIEGFGPSFSH